MSIPVYIGASFKAAKRIAKHAKRLEARNYDVLSHWFKPEYFIEKAWDKKMNGDVAEAMARLDFSQILQAKLIIIDTIDDSTTGGYHTELGMAIMRAFLCGTRVVHIGPVNNIFQTMVRERYETWDDFLQLSAKYVEED